MREIKYRGKVGSDWWYVTPDDDSWGLFWEAVDRETIGQYTGLHDRNGKEIYEGDIIHRHVQWGSDSPEEVRYENGRWSYSYDLVEYCEQPDTQWEVIGNLYETPVLVKATEKEQSQ